MKRYFLPVLLALALLQPGRSQAQNPGCDGSRYKDNVFTAVKKTTVQYSTASTPSGLINLEMDVYEPQGDNLSARPVVVLAHGGSFIIGNKTDLKSSCELLAKKGYVAASIQYRLYPFFVLGFPDSLDIFDQAIQAMGDMKAAVRYFRQDAATNNQFRADADNVFIGGYSAGAVTALHAGFLDSADAVPSFIQTIIDANGGLEGNSGSPENHGYSSAAKAIVSMSGGIYRSSWVDAKNIPLVSIHGTADGTVPYYFGLAADIAYLEGSGLIHPKVAAAGLLENLHTVPGGGHSDIYEQPQFKPHLDTFWVNVTTMLEYLACSTTAAPEVEAARENWSVYPNPATAGAFSLQLPASVRQATVSVSDLSGRPVYRKDGVRNREVIPVTSWPAGMYSVQIADPENPGKRFAAQKLILTGR